MPTGTGKQVLTLDFEEGIIAEKSLIMQSESF